METLEKRNGLSARQWAMLIFESFGWAGVMVMGYFFGSYYALIQDVFSYTPEEIANLYAIANATGAVASILGGFLADALKPKVNLSIAYLGLCALGAVVLTRPGYGVMMIAGIGLTFFGVGMFTPAMLRYISSLGNREQNAKIYGYFYMLAAAESLIIAPISANIIDSSGSYVGLRTIVFFFCGLIVISWIVHLVWIERAVGAQAAAGGEKSEEEKFSFKMMLEVLKQPNAWFVFIIGWVTCLPYELNTYVQPLLASEFQTPQGIVTLVASYANNGTALILAPLTGIIAAKIGSTAKVIAFSMILAIAASVGILVCPWDAAYFPIAVVIVVVLRSVFSIGKPARNSQISESRLPRKYRGTLVGVMFGLNAIFNTLLAKLTGYLVTNYGAMGYRVIYGGGVVVFIFGLVVALVFARKLQKAKEQDALNGGAPADLMI